MSTESKTSAKKSVKGEGLLLFLLSTKLHNRGFASYKYVHIKGLVVCILNYSNMNLSRLHFLQKN